MNVIFELKEPMQVNIEGTSAYFRKLKVVEFYGTKNTESAYTDIWQNLTVTTSMDNKKRAAGELVVFFRNQGVEFGWAMHLNTDVTIDGEADVPSTRILYLTVQYLFDWLENFVKTNEVKDNNGNFFVVPSFHYSEDQFKSIE